MSNRRKDMWKLLYDLVNKSETDLSDVFSFIEDILCKEPSLIRPYSLNEMNNRFQDNFIIWLISKLVRCLSDSRTEEIYCKNIEMQKHLLTSCHTIRPLLFERLIKAYCMAVTELGNELSEVDLHKLKEPGVPATRRDAQITAFQTSDDCLKEIDMQFRSQLIVIKFENIDRHVRALIAALHHAMELGFEMYPALFISSLECLQKVLRECVLSAKVMSLDYFGDLFRLAGSLSRNKIEGHYDFMIAILVTICEQIELWQKVRCVQQEDIEKFILVAIKLLSNQKNFISQVSGKHRLFQLAMRMLICISDTFIRLPHHRIIHLNALLNALVEFMVELQLQSAQTTALSPQQLKLLLDLALVQPVVLRIAISTVIGCQLQVSAVGNLFSMVESRLAELLSKSDLIINDLNYMTEVLSGGMMVEHCSWSRKQQALLEDGTRLEDVRVEQFTCELKYFSPSIESEFDKYVEQFLTHAERDQNVEVASAQLKVGALLLGFRPTRDLLKSRTQEKLLAYLEKPIRTLLSSAQELDENRWTLVSVALRELAGIRLDEGSKLFKSLQVMWRSIAQQLLGRQLPNATEHLQALRTELCEFSANLLSFGYLSREQLVRESLRSAQHKPTELASLLKAVFCSSQLRSCFALQLPPYASGPHANTANRMQLWCLECMEHGEDEVARHLEETRAVVLDWPNALKAASVSNWRDHMSTLMPRLCELMCCHAEFQFVGRHLELSAIQSSECLSVMAEAKDGASLYIPTLRIVLPHLLADEEFRKCIARWLHDAIVEALETCQPIERQLQLLQLIRCCALSELSENWLFYFFKMSFFFLAHPDSLVAQEAILLGTEMCAHHSLQPIQLWNWYKRDALSMIVNMVVFVYLSKGVRLTRSLKAFTKMLGFSCVQEFICKYYRLLVTMILPYCVKHEQCKGLLVSISKITRKSVATLFVSSFLRIYTHIYLTEETAVCNACIELIVRCTGCSLTKLLNTDVKQTVSEFLIYFNRNPKFVMHAFQSLLAQEGTASSVAGSTPGSNEFAKFIADRFLGVITYFETCLAEPNFEKPLKEEALYSLGQIIRFVGANHVTQFRFKIIAMLSFVLTLNEPHLQAICLKIWNIFLHIVNIQELGPSLSRIVAALQPLLAVSRDEVNAIYEFVILNNDSLLGAHIPDLYFLENMPEVAPAIRQCVARQTEILKSDKSSLLEKLSFLYRQITNENHQVRIYGLDYLHDFIAGHREEINRLVLSEIRVEPLLEQIVDVLLSGCRHDDRHLQLASAKCLGELGAIDPSYMPLNLTHEQTTRELAMNIHTDDFAIMALTELCRAYQFQKDTKYVDNFSLAIQETLAVFGVSPYQNKKINVWEAIPARLRQVMEPLLTSCYTGSRRESKCQEHPIFNSSHCRTYDEWAFLWASRLIDMVRSEETKHLLNSYKPSIKRDSNTLAIFFPYILLHALQECDEAMMQSIYEEFAAVLSFGSRGYVSQPEYETSGCKEFRSAKYLAEQTAEAARRPLTGAVPQYEGIEDISRSCTKLCSEQIDVLQRWTREWQRLNRSNAKVGDDDGDENFKRIMRFLAKFNKQEVARANYNSGDYARALRYLEEYIEVEPKVRLQENISFLIEIHGDLMDADSVEGAVYMKKTDLTLAEEILVNRIVDRPQEMMTCYEQLMSMPSGEHISQEHIKGMINCYLRMDTPETALLITDGLWQKLTDQYTDDYFKECKFELLWRLGRYDDLQELLEDSVVRRKTTNWNVQCAEAFLLFRQSPAAPLADFHAQLDVIRSNVLTSMRSCVGINRNTYRHCYDETIKLHLLNEVEKNKRLLHNLDELLSRESGANAASASGVVMSDGEGNGDGDGNGDDKTLRVMQSFLDDWDARLAVMQPVVRVMEPVLCFRRNLLVETKRLLLSHQIDDATLGSLIDEQIGKLWMRSVQMNRDAGSLQQAQMSIMKAAAYAPKALFIEKAKLLWQKSDQTHAFKLIEENLERIKGTDSVGSAALSGYDRALYAEAKFLQAIYNAESMNICAELNLSYFKEAIAYSRNSEKCYVQLAQYQEKLLDSYSPEQRDGDNSRNLIFDIMRNYARSLKYGCESVYQSLPRLLSFWLDFTADAARMSKGASTSSSNDVLKASAIQMMVKNMNDLMQNCISVLPTSIFYTAFSQLLSRICHPSEDVFAVVRSICVKLVDHFPHQSLWMLLPILKSSYSDRIKRCKAILTDARLSNPAFHKLLSDFNMLAERLIELTNKAVTMDQSYQLSALVKQLPRLFESPSFSNILLPFEKYMQASFPITSAMACGSLANVGNLPAASEGRECSNSIPTNPFPHAQIFITGINEEVVVLRSAAQPKKITIRCSDGKTYDVMVKPKDDLRRDFRLMEFNGLLKRYLHQDSQARHRRLRIRTYAAIPFNEECGLVEWLPKLCSFRSICYSIYRPRGLGVPDRVLRQYALPKERPIEEKRSVFVEKLLPRFPPVFHEWFRTRFPTPHSWYEARCAYVKTLAVMSMVGYILGLGDRHGENVLFDETNGDVVHVDFNCLFNQGENLQYPELVPFRLTHNLVFAMGPLGVEGMYRKCCEISLRVLKHESKTLMSVLRPFVHDLMVLSSYNSKRQSNGEMSSLKAMMKSLKRIEARLDGHVKKTLDNSIPLSTEGQVNFLIAEATDIDNLAAMYIGWGSFV